MYSTYTSDSFVIHFISFCFGFVLFCWVHALSPSIHPMNVYIIIVMIIMYEYKFKRTRARARAHTHTSFSRIPMQFQIKLDCFNWNIWIVNTVSQIVISISMKWTFVLSIVLSCRKNPFFVYFFRTIGVRCAIKWFSNVVFLEISYSSSPKLSQMVWKYRVKSFKRLREQKVEWEIDLSGF